MHNLPNIDADLIDIDAQPFAVLPGAPQTAAERKAAKRLARRVERKRFVRLQQRAVAINQIHTLPAPGESLHLALDGSYSAWSLVEAITELLPEPIEWLGLSTLGFNEQNLQSLLTMLDEGKTRHVVLYVSHYFRHSDVRIFERIRSELEGRGQHAIVLRNHAKLLLFETAHHAITVEMSANLRSSSNAEQATIFDCRELLKFHREWLEELRTATEEAQCQPTP